MMTKRLFDVIASALAIVALSPALLLIAVLIRVLDGRPVLFRQERTGRHGVPFTLLKFRTMAVTPDGSDGVTIGDDPRITRLGRLLRRFKLDELPQLMTVLKGEMSVVGPRPELEKYVRLFADDYREILRVRPGLTDPASLRYRSEASLLAASPDPERTYVEQILPDKLRLAREYVQGRSFALDLKVIAATLVNIVRR